MYKKILLLFVLFTIISCGEIQYDGEERLVFQTIVTNANGQPIANSKVEITVSTIYSSDLISKGKTDQDGKITLIFPSPKNDVDVNVKIYSDDTSYLEKNILKIRKEDFINYKLIFPNVNLLKTEETAPLQLQYNQTNFNTVLKKISINGIYHIDEEYYNYSPENYYLPSQILIKKNQTFQLKYTVLNLQTNSETNYVVDLQIGETPLTYTINY
ncbi:MAG: Ig-like domain-containing protein [Flavobacterium sp. JAD_PAG50586_2]|nr:MAG: Ig-like domain-containing protein [Flavobacterium sp. JAD_PAG50586_2]